MAGATLLTLLDDIAALLDDMAVLTKTAASKTAGVVGDDLALNAGQVMGTPAQRELPVIWAVAKGSFINKAILVPVAIALSTFLPIVITPLLMIGGLFLCFEGAEKLLPHPVSHGHDAPQNEKQKIKGAIRTDFILSAEIIIIALGIVADAQLATRIGVLCTIGIGMTVLVYGLVAAIVKLDDFGLYLSQKAGLWPKIGAGILISMPHFMRALGVIGTAAMFMVGGQILSHGIPTLHHVMPQGILGAMASGLFGLACGMIAAYALKLARRFF